MLFLNKNSRMKKIINSNQAPKPIGPYSQAIENNDIVFLSGQLGIDPETGNLVEGGIVEETKQAFKNISNILREGGYTLDSAIKVTCLLDNMDDFQAMNEIYKTQFTNNFPARTAFEVSRLPLNAKIEIEVIAVRRC